MKKIKVLREAAGLTQKELATELGVKVQLISNIERGMTPIPPKHFLTLAKVLNAKPEWFIKESMKLKEDKMRAKAEMNGGDRIRQVIKEAVENGNPLNEDHLKRLPISKNMNLEQTIALMAERNLGVTELLLRVVRLDPMALLDLDDMNMRGRQIWIAFNDFCTRDVKSFILHAAARNKDMVDFVNRIFPKAKAVTRGGAPK